MTVKRRRSHPASSEEHICHSKRARSLLSSLSDFSDEVLLRVLSFLDASSVAQIDLVCQRLKRLSRDEVLWRALYARDFGRASRRLSKPAQSASHPSNQRALGLLNPVDTQAKAKSWRQRYQVRSNWRQGRFRATRADETAGQVIGPWRVNVSEAEVVVVDAVSTSQIGRLHLSSKTRPRRIQACGKDHLALQFENDLELIRVQSEEGKLQLKSRCKIACRPTSLFSYAHDYLATLHRDGWLHTYRMIQGDSQARLISVLQGSVSGPRSLVIRKQGAEVVVSVAFLSLGILSDTVTIQQLVIDSNEHISTRVAHAATTTASLRHNSYDMNAEETYAKHYGSISYCHPFLLLAHTSSNIMTLYKVSTDPNKLLSLSRGRDLVGTGASSSSCGIGRQSRVAFGLGKAGLHVWNLSSTMGKAMHLMVPAKPGTSEQGAETNNTQIWQGEAIDEMDILHISEDRVVLREPGGTVTFDFAI
jgi:hypothetical protein